MKNSLWFPSGSGSVQDEERVFAVQCSGRAVRVDLRYFLMPPIIPVGGHVYRLIGALEDNHASDGLSVVLDRIVHVLL